MICARRRRRARRPGRVPAGRAGVPGHRQRREHRRGLASLRERAAGHDAQVVATRPATTRWSPSRDRRRPGSSRPLTGGLDLAAMKYYAGAFGEVAGRPAWVARTGYTGEDGFEVFCRRQGRRAHSGRRWRRRAPRPAWSRPGWRPAIRSGLKAGMPLYGNELGPDVTPFEAGLGRVVKFDKPGDFVGRAALAARASAGPRQRLVGLTIQSRRIARHGYPVLADGQDAAAPSRAAPRPPPSACRSPWPTWTAAADERDACPYCRHQGRSCARRT